MKKSSTGGRSLDAGSSRSTAAYPGRDRHVFDPQYVLEKMDLGVAVIDPGSLVPLYLNHQTSHVLGLDTSAVHGRSILNIVPERLHADVDHSLKRLDQKGRFGWTSFNVINKYEREVTFRAKGRYVTYQGTLVILVVIDWGMFPAKLVEPDEETFWHDVESMTINELGLDASWLIDQLPVGVGVATPDGAVRYVNGVHAQQLGYQPQEMLGHPNLSFIHSESKKNPNTIRQFLGALSFGGYDWFYVKANHKNGNAVHVNTRGTLETLYGLKCIVALFDYLSHSPV